MRATVIFPHQLFEHNPAVVPGADVYLVEEFLFFRQYRFHRQKLKYHRATMKFYERHLRRTGSNVVYVGSDSERSDVRRLLPALIDIESAEGSGGPRAPSNGRGVAPIRVGERRGVALRPLNFVPQST